MVNKKFAVIVPTNRVVRSWRSYCANFRSFKHNTENVKLIVVDDYSPCLKENVKIIRSCGIPFECWTLRMQRSFFRDNFGRSWKKYWQIIPHRTDACRSFGYLVAALWGADVIITFDDDNWAMGNSSDYDYLTGHGIVNSYFRGIEVRSDKGWFNTIFMLETNQPRAIYARGYPYYGRGEHYTFNHSHGKVVMNVGLWVGNPDVDAITLLSEGSMNGIPRARVTGLKKHRRITLARGLFAPLNTANTAYSSKLLPVIYDTFQGAQVGELKLDRFGDIWCNVFVKKAVDRVGDRITVGTPLVNHRREPRDTLIDLKKEFLGILVSQRLFKVVEQLDLDSRTYHDIYHELIQKLRRSDIYPESMQLRKYFQKLFFSMEKWLEIVDRLQN